MEETPGLGGDDDLSTEEQEYNPTPIINEIRTYVETWRNLPNSDQWLVTPETARLLKHWRHHQFEGIRPFFCQIEAVETAIWLVEVAPKLGARVAKFWAPPVVRFLLSRPGSGVTESVAPETRKQVRSKLGRFVRSRWFAPPFSGIGFSGLIADALKAK